MDFLVGDSLDSIQPNLEILIPLIKIHHLFLCLYPLSIFLISQMLLRSPFGAYSNLRALRRKSASSLIRIGRGLAFHITPSNVPVNFAFSRVFSLLAGNVNIVRVSDNDSPQVELIVTAINTLLSDPDYYLIKSRIHIVKYSKSSDYNNYFSSIADIRLIWGGDSTIQAFRKISSPSRCVDICFSDRYSLSIISSAAILASSNSDLSALYQCFYNDTFLFNQNACSSPHLLLWTDTHQQMSDAQHIFWQGFNQFLVNNHSQEDRFLGAVCCLLQMLLIQMD